MKENLIGLDLGGTSIKCGLVGPGGEILIRHSVPTDRSRGAEGVLASLELGARRVISEARGRGWKADGAGVGTPGAVDGETGVVAGGAENIPGWKGVPLVPELEKRLGIRVFASNDVTLNALGEARYGAGKGGKNIVCVAVGTGIGGGIIIEGEVYRGAGDAAGEVGHMTVKFNGRRCNCGSRGCLESYASATAIAGAGRRACRAEKNTLMLKLAGGERARISAKTVFDAAKRGDPAALSVVEEACFYLGAGISNLINLLNPEMVIIGGGVSRAGRILLEGVRKSAGEFALDINAGKAEIVLSKLHSSAGILGAAALCRQELEKSG